MFSLYLKDRCETQIKIPENILTTPVSNPIAFAYQYMEGPGYIATISGEVLWIRKCTPISAVPIKSDGNCYSELPVNRSGTVILMSPRNRILTKPRTIVPCAQRIVSKFKLWGDWYSQTSYGLETRDPPMTLEVSSLNYKFEKISSIESGGIYSKESMESLQRVLLNPIEDSARASLVASAVSQNGNKLPQGASVLSAIPVQELDNFSKKMGAFWYRLVTWLWKVVLEGGATLPKLHLQFLRITKDIW